MNDDPPASTFGTSTTSSQTPSGAKSSSAMSVPVTSIDDDLQAPTDWKRYAVLGAVGTTFAASFILMSPFVFMQLRSELPYMSTPRRKVLKALKCITTRTSSSRHNGRDQLPAASVRRKKFYDLGSGDGEAVLAAASAGWNATGIELNPTLWLISQMRRVLSPPHVRQHARFVMGDMFKHSIKSADAVMIFGVQPLMPRVASKIANECSAETCVLSYRFRIPTKETATHNGDGNASDGYEKLDAAIIFDDDEMRVWEINATHKKEKK